MYNPWYPQAGLGKMQMRIRRAVGASTITGYGDQRFGSQYSPQGVCSANLAALLNTWCGYHRSLLSSELCWASLDFELYSWAPLREQYWQHKTAHYVIYKVYPLFFQYELYNWKQSRSVSTQVDLHMGRTPWRVTEQRLWRRTLGDVSRDHKTVFHSLFWSSNPARCMMLLQPVLWQCNTLFGCCTWLHPRGRRLAAARSSERPAQWGSGHWSPAASGRIVQEAGSECRTGRQLANEK